MKPPRPVWLPGAISPWWVRSSTSTHWIRNFVSLIGVLLLIIGGSGVAAVRIQTNEFRHFSDTFTKLIDANQQVLLSMTEANSELIQYEIITIPAILDSYNRARERTMTALATLQDRLILAPGQDATDSAQLTDLSGRQNLAVQQWLSTAQETVRTLSRGSRTDMASGLAIFDDFLLVNIALGDELADERVKSLDVARAYLGAITLEIVIVTILALVTIIVLMRRYLRTVSKPVTELHDILTRHNRGEIEIRAREDQGSGEIRQLAVDFNSLVSRNRDAQRRLEDMSARLVGSVDASLSQGQEISYADFLNQIIDLARQMIRVQYVALELIDPTRLGLTEFMIGDSQAFRLEQRADESRLAEFSELNPMMDSVLRIPIVIRGEVFGNLHLTNKVDGPFTAEDEYLSGVFAFQAIVAMQYVRMYETGRQHIISLQRVREIELAIREASGIQQALDVMCAELGEALDVDRVKTDTHHDGEIDLRFGSEWHRPNLQSLGPVPDYMAQNSTRLAEELWRTVRHRVTDDYLAVPVHAEGPQIFLRYTNARAAIIVPIMIGDRALGSIYVIMTDQPRHWTESEVELVETISEFVGRLIFDAVFQMHQAVHIERLEQLERQQKNFVSTVTHELRTPLTSITGYLELLMDGGAGDLDNEQHRMLEVIDRNAIRLRKLIENIILLNLRETDRTNVVFDEVHIQELVADVCQDLAPLVQSKAIVFEIELDPDGVIVRGNRSNLYSAVANVISNAIKFSRKGDKVSISCAHDQGTGRATFICQDRGIGIPVEDQPRLFTQFFRASNATNQEIPGTGLGLHIVKQIVEDCGGQVRIVSSEGNGTTAVIDLPMSRKLGITVNEMGLV